MVKIHTGCRREFEVAGVISRRMYAGAAAIAAVAGLVVVVSPDALLGGAGPAGVASRSGTGPTVSSPMHPSHPASTPERPSNRPAGVRESGDTGHEAAASRPAPPTAAPEQVDLPPSGQEGVWQMECYLSHSRPDDPIVSPNQPGGSHMHSFFGNVSTDAASTADSLMASTSNCIRNMATSDRSAYWIPALYHEGADGTSTMVRASAQRVFAYYRRVGPDDGPKVQPFPLGLRMIAGDVTSRSTQPMSVLFWDCGFGGPTFGAMPTCQGDDNPLHVKIRFPSCWDGENLDSPDHKSHMAYPAKTGRCPASHPVPVPELTLEPHYLDVPGGPAYSLSSGNPYSMHADFYAAWDPSVQKALVTECLNIRRGCFDINRRGNVLFRPDSPGEPHVPPIDISRYE